MELNEHPNQMPIVTSGYLRSLVKAIERAHQLFHQQSAVLDQDRIHAVKSSIYVAMERSSIEVEHLLAVRRTLRELLCLVSIQSDASWKERQEAIKVLEELRTNVPA
ncbi:MAG TPA: hypothetical protein PLO78_07290 [Candidatus Omnitrophota bacterium]|nr:hypothetical protein [Candidatus Omnitrophota bacterium]